MFSFNNDYSEGAHPRILDAMCKYNLEQNNGYGEDAHSLKANEYIKRHIGRDDVDIHFIPGGTQTNMLVISSFLRPHHCVISADTGHINVHETGAVEATGHKVVTIPHIDGKITVEGIAEVQNYHSDEHMVLPRMVYISDTTELGTIYTKDELSQISEYCKNNNLLLFLDGARIASALTCKANDLTLHDIANLVDVFYIGGTKNGALLGEALVICNDDLKEDFRYLIKHRGAMMAKGFVMGIQFEALFQDDLYFELGKHANLMAEKIGASFMDCGYGFYAPAQTNQLFPILTNDMIEKLSKKFLFSIQKKIDESHSAVRFDTSWATSEESVNALINEIQF
ncbi:MAG TPA: aminotransferase class V-fold PLP-dependent enzyme [Clostridiales bacterium]|nr:aminotransferase class V-fold PLP-dependent enzyme [Clostridiales bacterium]